MKIIAVYGSSRPGSLSAGLMDEILRGAADAGHEIVRLNINQLQLPAAASGVRAASAPARTAS